MRKTVSICVTFCLALALGACAAEPAGTTLAAFEEQDRASAKAAYQAMSDAEKVALWREHFARETGATRFPPAQAAVIADTVANLPALVAAFDGTRAAQAEAAFTQEQMAKLFELPGRWPGDEVRLAAAAESCDTRWCLCGLPPQPPGLVCNGAHCSSTNGGCGWFGQQSCTRQCYIADELD